MFLGSRNLNNIRNFESCWSANTVFHSLKLPNDTDCDGILESNLVAVVC